MVLKNMLMPVAKKSIIESVVVGYLHELFILSIVLLDVSHGEENANSY